MRITGKHRIFWTPWLHWAARTLIYMVVAAGLGMIAAGVAVAVYRTYMHDY